MPTTFDTDAYPHGVRLDSEAREHEKRVEAAKKAAKTRAASKKTEVALIAPVDAAPDANA